MEMVAASKLRRAQTALMAARPYSAKLQELLSHLAGGELLAQNPLFQERTGNHKILVMFTSDRGLSGSFNVNIIKAAEALMKAEPETRWELICVGRKGRDYFARRRVPILDSVIGLGGKADLAEARRISQMLVDLYLAGRADAIVLLYSEFISTVVYRPQAAQYLPLTPQALGLEPEGEDHKGYDIDYILEPSAQEVFDQLLPRFLSAKIFITMAEVATSEHSARMIAMNNATKNCSELVDSLTLRMNKARQGAITRELLDIVAGAEAQKMGATS
jgi:F-type H+-transporting ATPase subunit gamma